MKGYWHNTLPVFSSSLFSNVSKQKYSFLELLSPYRQNTSNTKVNDLKIPFKSVHFGSGLIKLQIDIIQNNQKKEMRKKELITKIDSFYEICFIHLFII